MFNSTHEDNPNKEDDIVYPFHGSVSYSHISQESNGICCPAKRIDLIKDFHLSSKTPRSQST